MKGADHPGEYLSGPEVWRRYGIHRDTWYQWRRRGIAPAGVLLAPGVRRWRLAELEAWERSRSAARETTKD